VAAIPHAAVLDSRRCHLLSLGFLRLAALIFFYLAVVQENLAVERLQNSLHSLESLCRKNA
ncbi:hypothetical protein A2U01_0023195, partial [Trifolium medium]|nr:hypothetical protein [Trifolium medium]